MTRERNSFKTPLVVEVMGKRFRLHYNFTYRWKYKGLTIVISVPAGFETDFASIPRFAWILIPKLGRWNKAAVIHDWLYQHGALSRKQADRCFRDGMRDKGVKPWQYNLIYWAVRLFGWLAWKRGG